MILLKLEYTMGLIIKIQDRKEETDNFSMNPWQEARPSNQSDGNSALDGGEWSASRPGRSLAPGKGPPGAHCTGGWVGPRAGLDRGRRKNPLFLPGIKPRSPGRPARIQTLYCLSYPAHTATALAYRYCLYS